LSAAPCRNEGKTLPRVRFAEVATGLRHPTHIANAGDGSGRLFVVEQAGRVLVLRNGKLQKEPFLDIRERVASGGEKGLLSIAFHPEFKTNGRFFVNYTSDRGGLHTVVSEFKDGAEKILLMVKQPYSNHNGGQLAFGPDGLLYAGMGDGGSGDDPGNRAQNPAELLGKMLRLDVDAPLPQIYASGLRNPWRFSFDPVTGLLYAGDVGQDHWEEIDVVERGKNYGWRVMEGFHCNPGVEDPCDPKKYAPPIHEYPRTDGISVTGGFVYRGKAVLALCGAYVFGDYGEGTVWALRYDPKAKKAGAAVKISDSGAALSSFGVDENWEIYAADHSGGRVLRLVPTSSAW
jgi:glucose/arabinose dehydrogenase